jgi:hypothetical protein
MLTLDRNDGGRPDVIFFDLKRQRNGTFHSGMKILMAIGLWLVITTTEA